MPDFEPATWLKETEKEGEKVAPSLSASMERFIEGKNHSQERFVEVLRSVMRQPLSEAVEEHWRLLRAKGFTALRAMAKAADEVVQETLRNTNDLRETILDADDDRDEEDSLTAGFGLKALLSSTHQKLVASSLLRNVRDRFERKTLEAQRVESVAPGFTGRRRWNADPSGRHAVLDGVVVESGENWSLPARTINGRNYPAVKDVPFPRFNPSDPKEWSGSTSSISYEFRLDDGSVEWR